jgi:lipopolysaccharide export system permease protein
MNRHSPKRGQPWQVWRYIAAQYTLIFSGVLLTLLSLIYVFEVVELLRRSSSKTALLSDVLMMGFFKLPEVGMRIFPFAILFAGLICFWRLARTSELVVLRASGVSAWQFALPAMLAAFMIAVVKITVLNPAGAFAFSMYQEWDNHVLRGQQNTVAFTDSGLWLRQINENKTQAVIHAATIDSADWSLRDVMLLLFSAKGQFLMRVDAPMAKLIPGKSWDIQNAVSTRASGLPNFSPNAVLPTHLTPSKIEEQFAAPDAVSFWKLPRLIRTIRHTGLAATKLELHYYSLLAEPLLFMGIALLSVAFALRNQRGGGVMQLILSGLGVGFALFFLGDFMRALANSDVIPITLAAWTPALLAIMIGASILLYVEDG